MPINIITSDNLNRAVAKTIEAARLTARDIGAPVLIIVPDRFTLQCERILMRDTAALLNVRVVTFSMLYNILSSELSTEGDEKKILDKTAAVLYMWRAIQDVGDKLIWFSKSVGHYSFAEKMFNTINQLVSSMVDFDGLEKNATAEITRKKMHDIALIREHYKKLTKEHTDGSSMLGYLIENVRHSKLIREAKVFFTGFEHLSLQRSAVVFELIKAAGGFTAGLRNNSETNSFFTDIVFNNKFQSAVTVCKEKAESDTLLTIFGQEKARAKLTCCEIAQCENIQEEAAWVANQIARLVKKDGVRFKDIVVTLGDYDHTAKIFEQTFTQNGIAVNADVGGSLLEMPLALFVHNMLLLANSGKCESIIAAAKSGYCGLSIAEEFELENFCLKYNASLFVLRKGIEDENAADDLRTAVVKFNANIISPVSKLSKCKNVNDIANLLLQVIEKSRLPDLAEEQLITENIARDKLAKLLTTCAEILGNQRMTLQEFSNMFGTLAAATKVSAVPTYADAVTLVAAKEYESSFVPFLFVCGCNDGVFPIEQDDTDIITEYDIANMKSRVEPTATMQNNRARQHAVNILSSFQTRLLISYTSASVTGDAARPSELVERIFRLMPTRDNSGSCETADNALFSRSWAANLVLRSIGDGTAYTDPVTYNSILKAVEAGDLLVPDFEKLPGKLSNARQLFFDGNAAGVTQFENFYKCPYYHFLQNGLKLYPRESIRAAANIMGSLVHKIVELFLRIVIDKGVDLDVSAEMKKCVAEALSDQKFVYFTVEPINKPIIASIEKQAQRIGFGLVANIKAGSYRPKYVEKHFEQQITENLKYRGIVDRIDTAPIDGQKSALVIDYKTGADSVFSFKQLYLGTKLQLPLYMKAFAGSYELGGACYLPLRGGFSNEANSGLKMNGIVLNTESNASALDSNLAVPGKSDIVPLVNKGYKITGGVTQQQLSSVIDYASVMLGNAAKHIADGYISPCPVSQKVCDYCVCSAMCLNKSSARGGDVPVMSAKSIERIMSDDNGGAGDE